MLRLADKAKGCIVDDRMIILEVPPSPGGIAVTRKVPIPLVRKVGRRVWECRIDGIPCFARQIRLSRSEELFRMQAYSRLAICNAIPHFPVLYATVRCGQGKRGYYLAFTEAFHSSLRAWFKVETSRESAKVMPALAQIMMALAVLHGRNMRHGSLSPDNIVLFRYPAQKGWWMYRIGDRDIYIRKSGTLFALNNFAKSEEFGNNNVRLEPHCEVIALLDMFRRHMRRKVYLGMVNIAQEGKMDAAMFMRDPRVMRLFNSYASLVVTDKSQTTDPMDRFDVLLPEYKPRQGTGNCRKPRRGLFSGMKGNGSGRNWSMGDLDNFFSGLTLGLAK